MSNPLFDQYDQARHVLEQLPDERRDEGRAACVLAALTATAVLVSRSTDRNPEKIDELIRTQLVIASELLHPMVRMFHDECPQPLDLVKKLARAHEFAGDEEKTTEAILESIFADFAAQRLLPG